MSGCQSGDDDDPWHHGMFFADTRSGRQRALLVGPPSNVIINHQACPDGLVPVARMGTTWCDQRPTGGTAQTNKRGLPHDPVVPQVSTNGLRL
jgi:hypothetical protein